MKLTKNWGSRPSTLSTDDADLPAACAGRGRKVEESLDDMGGGLAVDVEDCTVDEDALLEDSN